MVVHQVMPYLFAAVAKSVGEGIRHRIQEDMGGTKGGCIEEDNLGEVLFGFHRLCIQNHYAFGALGFLVVDHFNGDGIGAHGQVACCSGGRKGGGVGAEISSERTTLLAFVAELTRATGTNFGSMVGCTANDHWPSHFGFEVFLHHSFNAVHLHGRKEFSIRHHRQSIA